VKQRDDCDALLANDSRVVRGISVSGIQIGWLNSSQELRIQPSVPKTRVRYDSHDIHRTSGYEIASIESP
jgi:hypothetical protein